jgi:hypothetical protein
MMNEENYIKEKMGTRNPFTVPDGYFDQLAQQIIDSLPVEVGEAPVSALSPVSPSPRPAIVRYLRPLLYAAACALLAIVVGAVYRNVATADSEQLVAHQQEAVATYSDTYMEDLADYAMLDNEEIYASLLADL